MTFAEYQPGVCDLRALRAGKPVITFSKTTVTTTTKTMGG